jgi:hypothetical protein
MKLALAGQISVMKFRTENPGNGSVGDGRGFHIRFFISLISPRIEQDRQHTYKVTLRSFCLTLFQLKSNKYCIFWVSVCVCVCVCSLSYPACSAHVPFCHLWPVWLYNKIVFTLSHKRHDIRKMLLSIKCVSWLSLYLFSETALILKRIERDVIKCT